MGQIIALLKHIGRTPDEITEEIKNIHLPQAPGFRESSLLTASLRALVVTCIKDGDVDEIMSWPQKSGIYLHTNFIELSIDNPKLQPRIIATVLEMLEEGLLEEDLNANIKFITYLAKQGSAFRNCLKAPDILERLAVIALDQGDGEPLEVQKDHAKAALSEILELSDLSVIVLGDQLFFRRDCVIKVKNGNDELYVLLIPAIGLPEIYRDQYRNKKHKKVIISKSVKRILSHAFCRCENLTSVDFRNVEEIGPFAFGACVSLTQVALGRKVSEISKGAFALCKSLASVHLKNVEIIGQQAFAGCDSLTSVDLSNVKTIGEYAFECCINLKSVTLGKNVRTIEEGAFKLCPRQLVVNCATEDQVGMLIEAGLDRSQILFAGGAPRLSILNYLKCTEGEGGKCRDFCNIM